MTPSGLAATDVDSFTSPILITGGAGQVGNALRNASWPAGAVLHAPSRDELDLCSLDDVSDYLRDNCIAAVVNLAAYTAVDLAEKNPLQAIEGNAVLPATLARASGAAGLPIVHLSTDYVFDGLSDRPYVETDPTNPAGMYGHSKRAGEYAVLAGNSRAVVIRTAWIISPFKTNFLKTMLRLADEHDTIRVVSDQIGNPTSAFDLADAVTRITMRLTSDTTARTGLYHAVNSGEASWAELADEILRQSALRGGATARVEHITTEDYPTVAKRPSNSRLSTDKLLQDYGIRMPPWQSGVASIVASLHGAN